MRKRSNSWNGARVLLVEDNDLNQELALGLLGEAGIGVVCAENGVRRSTCWRETPTSTAS
jgi:CheY-like chemotaxis protein